MNTLEPCQDKSHLLLHRLCPKRLWLNQYRPELKQDDSAADVRMANGNQLAKLARTLHPGGVLIDGKNLSSAIEDTAKALQGKMRPIYGATFVHHGVKVQADLLLPERCGYRLVVVSPLDKAKPYYVEDAAIQTWVIHNAGLDIRRVVIAHVNTSFIYTGSIDQRMFVGGGEELDCPGVGEYGGLLAHVNVSEQVEAWVSKVPKWIRAMHKTLKGDEPKIAPGKHCIKPFTCPFQSYCSPEVSSYPVDELNDKALVTKLRAAGYSDLRKVPKSRLSKTKHLRIRRATKTGRAVLEPKAAKILANVDYPRYYLSFGTIQFAVPIWSSTGAYMELPVQWACHIEDKAGGIRHMAYLATDTGNPQREFAEKLIHCLRGHGPVFVYHQTFEAYLLLGLTTILFDLAPALNSIIQRMVALLPIAQKHYYHRDMHGSWLIKNVLPTIAPELAYDDLALTNSDRVSLAHIKINDPATSASERQRLRQNLLDYRARESLALVRLAHYFQGK